MLQLQSIKPKMFEFEIEGKHFEIPSIHSLSTAQLEPLMEYAVSGTMDSPEARLATSGLIFGLIKDHAPEALSLLGLEGVGMLMQGWWTEANQDGQAGEFLASSD